MLSSSEIPRHTLCLSCVRITNSFCQRCLRAIFVLSCAAAASAVAAAAAHGADAFVPPIKTQHNYG